MGRASRGVAVVAASRHIDASSGCLSVDRSRVDLNRVVDENVVLRRDIEVFVTRAACLREVGGVDRRTLCRRREDVVVTVAVRALRHILARTESRAAVRLVCLRRVLVTRAASLAAGIERLLELAMGHGVAIDMTVEAVEAIMYGVRDVVGKRRTVPAGLVTVGADRAINLFKFLSLSPSKAGADQKAKGDGGWHEKRSLVGIEVFRN